MSINSFDKRRHERKDTITSIEYVINDMNKEEVFDGVIANISESGFCLLTTNHLNKEEKIEIKQKNYVKSQIATVRWSNQFHNYYKVGLEFV